LKNDTKGKGTQNGNTNVMEVTVARRNLAEDGRENDGGLYQFEARRAGPYSTKAIAGEGF
jgi:hypothetical protein